MVELFGIKVMDKIGKYLGSYVDCSTDRRTIGKEIIQKISKKLQGWKAQMLSQVGRLILYKSVLQSFPLYHFTTAKLIKEDIDHIMRIISQFWWANF